MIEKQLTVCELRDLLTKLVEKGVGDLPIVIEGCDCDGKAGNVDLEAGCAYIRRV